MFLLSILQDNIVAPPNNFWAILIPSTAAIITALNLKGILAEWNARKAIKLNEIQAELKKGEVVYKELNARYRAERESRKKAEIQLKDNVNQLNNMKLRLSIAIPLIEAANHSDTKTLELIQIIKDGLGIHKTPAL